MSVPVIFSRTRETSRDLDLLPNGCWPAVLARMVSIANAVANTSLRNRGALEASCELIANWMHNHSVVRFVGAGRALWAASMPANRMAHGGAQVSFVGSVVPLPNSERGGGIIACSASGKTRAVIEAMETARKRNGDIQIIGFARHDAKVFEQLSNIFVGIHVSHEYPNPLSVLADTEEYVISEILDGLVVMAGMKLGLDDDAWRRGHEDIGPTGPYQPVASSRATGLAQK